MPTHQQVARAKRESSRAAKGLVRVYRLDHRRWRELSRKFKAHSRSQNLPCHLCRNAIDYSLTTGRWCFEADHKYPRKTYPHLMFTWSNLLPSHRTCNRSRQAKAVVPQQLWIQPDW